MNSILMYLIVCPMVGLAGFIDSIAGGGGLVTLPVYMMTGLPVHNCLATNKMSSSMGTCISTAKYASRGFVPWRIAPFCVPCAFAGSVLGANIALVISDGPFKILMLIILPLTGAYVLFKKDLSPSGEELPFRKSLVLSMVIAFLIGIYDGFYGPGTGTFLILLLTGIARMKLERANGLTKVINLSTNISALAVFLINHQVVLPLGIAAGCCNIIGNYIGATHFEKGGSKIARPVILIVLGLFIIKLVWELFI
ncbi:MAG: TSUP family transporter [Lachnospiraceae bacterium]|nr:TSUP family transporter [Lachnospiraceae bacterium]